MRTPAWVGRIGPYAIVASAVTVVDYSTFIALTWLAGMAPIPANICGWAVAVVVAYGLHSAYTFKNSISWRSFFGYVAVCLTTLVIGTACLSVFMIFITPLAAKVASTVVVFAVSFALSHSTVFKAAL